LWFFYIFFKFDKVTKFVIIYKAWKVRIDSVVINRLSSDMHFREWRRMHVSTIHHKTIIWKKSNRRKKITLKIPVQKIGSSNANVNSEVHEIEKYSKFRVINEVGEKQRSELRIKMRLQISRIGNRLEIINIQWNCTLVEHNRWTNAYIAVKSQ